MVEVTVSRLGLDANNQAYVVILQEKEGERVLPIWIGHTEAEAIVAQMHNIKRPRPYTHDLCKSIIQGLGGTLRRVVITRVENNTYYAEMHLAGAGQPVQLDARPSDAIAVALRLAAPIFADDELLAVLEIGSAEESAPTVEAPDDSAMSAEELQEYLERLRPEDFGEFKP
jgi:bifunctional DNase/RNase